VATTLIDTLSSLKAFGTTIVIMFILIRNVFWTFVFLRQFGARCSTLKQIMHGYLKGILVGLTSFAVTSTTSSTTLVSTIITTTYSFFYYDKFLWHDLFYNNLNRLVVV